ncbi:hypothetical protein FRC06_003826 [Ceratobasidium sp. 370]|nr:hypothetical protein FRC06_003826 [Ceratobasidium sp. 370]
MIDYFNPCPPPEDPTSDSRAIDEHGFMFVHDLHLLGDSGWGPTFSSILPVPPMHNDNPNSSFGRCLYPHDQRIFNRDGPNGAPIVPALPIQPAFNNQIIPLAQPGPGVDGKIYRRDANGIVQLHKRFIPTSSTFVSPNLVVPGSIFSIGNLVFCVNELGGLFKADDGVEPVEVFDDEDTAWKSLGISMAPTDAPSPSVPATPSQSGVLSYSPSRLIYTPGEFRVRILSLVG